MDVWEILTPILENVLAGVATLAIGAISYYLRAWLLARIGQENLTMATAIVRAAVLAVEQESIKYGWDSDEKKEQATQIVQIWLNENGIQLDASRVAEAIESAVFAEINKWRTAVDEE